MNGDDEETSHTGFDAIWSNLKWDLRINRGASWDCIRAQMLLIEYRLEQLVYSWTARFPGIAGRALWFLVRGSGSLFQSVLCQSNIPGTARIGRGVRLPHPQNLMIAGTAEIGEFCTIYHQVSIAWNGFKKRSPGRPRIGDRVLLGTGAILIGDISIGTDVLIGAGAVVTTSVPDHSRVTCGRVEISFRQPSGSAAEPGSQRHLADPYSIWR